MKNTPEEVSWGEALSLTYDNLAYLEGELLTLIEILGLPDKQEEALKSKFRKTYWGRLERNAYHITPDEHNVIRKRDMLALMKTDSGRRR